MITNLLKNVKFSDYYKKLNIFSLILIISSILIIFIKGLNLGVDFKGGTLIEVRTESPMIDIAEILDIKNIDDFGWFSWSGALIFDGFALGKLQKPLSPRSDGVRGTSAALDRMEIHLWSLSDRF